MAQEGPVEVQTELDGGSVAHGINYEPDAVAYTELFGIPVRDEVRIGQLAGNLLGDEATLETLVQSRGVGQL